MLTENFEQILLDDTIVTSEDAFSEHFCSIWSLMAQIIGHFAYLKHQKRVYK